MNYKRAFLTGSILAALCLVFLYNSTYARALMQTVPTAAPSATPSPIVNNPNNSPTPTYLPTRKISTPTLPALSTQVNTPKEQNTEPAEGTLETLPLLTITPTLNPSGIQFSDTPFINETTEIPNTSGMLSATQWLKSLYLLICGISVIGGGVVIAIILTRKKNNPTSK